MPERGEDPVFVVVVCTGEHGHHQPINDAGAPAGVFVILLAAIIVSIRKHRKVVNSYAENEQI